jgi:hypothetical protein
VARGAIGRGPDEAKGGIPRVFRGIFVVPAWRKVAQGQSPTRADSEGTRGEIGFVRQKLHAWRSGGDHGSLQGGPLRAGLQVTTRKAGRVPRQLLLCPATDGLAGQTRATAST